MAKDWARMGEKARILIVDDDESTCRSMKIIFDKKGYETDTVFSGEAAKDKVQSTSYDLIFLDIILPDFDGIGLLTYLDEMCPGTAFVMITEQASVRTAVRALNRGASGYVVKPFDMDEVLSAVSRALESRRMTRVKERILIVDDDESICRTMNLIFEAKNYDTEIVYSGQEAIAAIKKRPYNLAILDIRLPDVDGIILLEQLSKINADIGIIMITGYASTETAVDALNKGAAAYITKPLNMDEVLITVNKALGKQRLMRAKLRAEVALQEERDRAQKYLDIAGVAFIVLDENGLVGLINTKGCEIMGREDYEVLGQNWFDIAVPKELRGEAMNIFNSLTSGAVDEVEYYEGDILTKNNERKTIAWHYAALTDRSKKVIGTLCSGEDITERKRAMRAVEERVKELTCLLGTSQLASKPELAVDAFLKGVVNILPPAWFHAEVTCARILLDGLVVTTSNFKETKWKQVADINVEKERRGAVEVYYLEQRPELDEGSFLKEKRALIGGIAEQIGNAVGRWQAEEQLRELTEELEQRVEKRTQELAASNQELEAFAYSVSHDLRSPLRGIAGFSMAVLEDYSSLLDETGRDYLRRMHEATVRMSELIDDILSLSRVAKGEMYSEEIDMTALARTIAGELRSQEPGRKAKLVISDNLEAYGDKRLMYLVLENLLGNAWKFTSKQRSARIEFGATEQENETVFFVRDNGVGFDMKYVDKLFDVFQRLHHADEFEGTGIGLAIVKRIINRHGGRTWAEGNVGKGATFYFTLPSKGSEVLT